MEDVIKKNNSDKNSQILYDQNNLKLSYLENPLGESPSFLTPKIYEDERENIINATDEIIDSYLKRNNIGWSRDFSFPKILEKHKSISNKIFATFYEIGKGTQQNKTEALKWYKLFLENNGEYNPTYNIKDTIMEKTTLSIKSLINDIEREITRNELDEIIEAYLKHNSIGETKSFSFFKVLKNYESKSQEIFKCLNNNQTIRNYEVIVGKFHEMGFGTNENMDKAFKWYIDASKQNNYNGILETGNCYYNGNGVVKNCDKAFEFFQRAVNESKEKLNRALYSLATCYKSGDGIRKMNETNQQLLREHQVKAFELYKKSAENGFVLSQRELAECYKDGIGTQKNRDEASKWEKKYTTSQNELVNTFNTY
ncbi:11017_t:CDS:2 [Rhizophagus irregularis]|nr:11017_t:CDS:2 [Rhizophagus irregularis]